MITRISATFSFGRLLPAKKKERWTKKKSSHLHGSHKKLDRQLFLDDGPVFALALTAKNKKEKIECTGILTKRELFFLP